MVAKGYAVLLPDPALSTGYGARMIERGWGQWGGAPFTDLMAITDAVVARPDIDQSRTAAMGGSYGGYMANWVAAHTDRFRCIVTHASLWALDQFQATTDLPGYWVKEWGSLTERPERYERWSPHRFVEAISTPMLVVHGDKDYRVPVGEALRLWTDLQRAGVPSAYLHFPDEGHWVLKPGNARVWYETVWAFLDQHVHDRPWQQPDLLWARRHRTVVRVATGTPATALLTRAKVPFTLHPYDHDPRAQAYGEEAAAALGVDPARIFKTLIAAVDGKLACARRACRRPAGPQGAGRRRSAASGPRLAEPGGRRAGDRLRGRRHLAPRPEIPAAGGRRRLGEPVRDRLRLGRPARAAGGTAPPEDLHAAPPARPAAPIAGDD